MPKRTPNSLRRYFLPAIASLGIAGFILLTGLQVHFFVLQRQQAVQAHEWVEHTNIVLQKLSGLVLKIRESESDLRGFVLTNDPYFLSSDKNGQTQLTNIAEINRRLDDISFLIRDNQNQIQTFDHLKDAVRQKIEYMQGILNVSRSNNIEKIKFYEKGNNGKALMSNVQKNVDLMIQVERNLLNERQEKSRILEKRFMHDLILAAVLTYTIILSTIALIILVFYRVRNAERQLILKESYFRAAAERGTDTFFVFHTRNDEKGEIKEFFLTYMNPVAEQTLHRPFESLAGEGIETVMVDLCGCAKASTELYKQVFESRKARQIEYQSQNGPRKGKFFQQQTIPLANGVAIVCRDITERKQVEQMKNEFVSTVSHELRTPLTSIRGSLGLIVGGLAGQIPEQTAHLLQIAYKNCERLVRLINDILDIEKIESGRVVFENRPIMLLPVLENAVESNRAFADKYTVSLHIESPSTESVSVMADQDRLIQVLTNLMSNAIKFSLPHGVVTLRYYLDNGYVRIEVRDQGKGIPVEFRKRIFEKFAQADGSDTREKEGTGLGLSIAKAIVEQMKGRIGFKTSAKGTVFYFTLPLVEEKRASQKENDVEGNDRDRILICEDEDDIAHFLELILERSGFIVDIASGAAAARELLEKHNYTAMTLDLLLPDSDGIKFIRELRADKRFFNLPIIVVSARAEEGKKQLNGDAIGILDWLIKPIDIKRLVRIVENIERKPPRILHVEDDKDIAEVLRLSLSPIAKIYWTDYLQTAKELIEKERFDLIILDITLPDGKGTELLPLLGSQGKHPTPVILFTAADVTNEITSRVAAVLTKSRTSEEKLLATIQDIISKTNSNFKEVSAWKN